MKTPLKTQKPLISLWRKKGSFNFLTILIYLPPAFKPLGCRGYDDANGLNDYYII